MSESIGGSRILVWEGAGGLSQVAEGKKTRVVVLFTGIWVAFNGGGLSPLSTPWIRH